MNILTHSEAAISTPLPIEARDVEAMNFWLNDSPIADPFRQNAICFALQRLLAPGTEVWLSSREDGRVDAVVNHAISVPLPNRLAAWWHQVLSGRQVQPPASRIELPVDLLASPPSDSTQESDRSRPTPSAYPTANAA